MKRALRTALFCLLLSLGLVAQVSAAPEAPCFACQNPTVLGSGFGVPQPESNQDPSPTAPAVKDVNVPSGKGFIYEKVKKGEFNPEPVNLWYLEKDAAIEDPIFHIDLISYPNGSTLMGQVSDWFFTFYKMILHAVITLIGAVAFGLFFIGILMEPALNLASQVQQQLIGPFALWKIVVAIGAGWLAFTFFVKRNIAGAATEYVWMALVLAIGAAFVPVDAIRYLVSLVAGASAVVLMAGVGEDPERVPAASTAPIDTSSLLDVYHRFTAGFEDLLIGQMAQILIFKEKLPKVCEVAYEKGVAQDLTITDPKNFKYMNELEQCQPFAKVGVVAGADRAVYSAILVGFVLFLAFALLKIAWPAIKGQIQVMAALAAHKLLFLAAALPGPLKAPAVIFLYKTMMGLIGLIVLSLYLSGILIGMKIVLEATTDLVMFWRLLLLLAIPFAALGIHKRQQKAMARREKEFQKSIERERTVSPQQSPKMNRAEQFVVDNMKYEGAKKVISGAKKQMTKQPYDHKEETTVTDSGASKTVSTSKPTAPNTTPQYEYKYAETAKSGSEDELRRTGYYKGRTVSQEDIIGTATEANGNGHRRTFIPDPPVEEPKAEPSASSGLVKGALDIQTPVHKDEYGKKPDPETHKARQEHLTRMAERNRALREKLEQ